MTLRYDPRMKLEAKEEYLTRMKTHFQPPIKEVRSRADTDESKDEKIKRLTKNNISL